MITSSTADLGPLSLDSFRKNNLSASWKVIGVDNTSVEDNAASEVRMTHYCHALVESCAKYYVVCTIVCDC